MKTTLVISLEEDNVDFLEKQGEIDPSAFINEILRDEKARRAKDPGKYKPAAQTQKAWEAAPSASRLNKNNTAQVLEVEMSDLDTPAGD